MGPNLSKKERKGKRLSGEVDHVVKVLPASFQRLLPYLGGWAEWKRGKRSESRKFRGNIAFQELRTDVKGEWVNGKGHH